jgi:hypothetical protein
MSGPGYAAFIEDCVQVRASLVGLIEAIEGNMLAPGMPIAARSDERKSGSDAGYL